MNSLYSGKSYFAMNTVCELSIVLVSTYYYPIVVNKVLPLNKQTLVNIQEVNLRKQEAACMKQNDVLCKQ